MTKTGRPRPMIYLLVEAALILGLAYFTFIGGAISGLYLYGPRLVSQAIIGIVAGCWLASQFLRRRAWPASPIDRPLSAVLVVVVLATIFSVHPRLSLDATLIVFTYALAFWFLYDQMQAAWFADLMLKCLLIVEGIVCLIASNELLSWYFGLPNGPSWPSLNLGVWPPTPPRIGNASLGSPNLLAGYLAPLLPLVVVRGLTSSRPAKRVGFWLLSLWMLGLIVVSRSRGGLLGAMGGLVALGIGSWAWLGANRPWLHPTRRRIAVVTLLLAVGVVGLTMALRQGFGDGAVLVRLDVWAAALQMVARRPIFGVGPGVFGFEYLRYRDTTRFVEIFSHAHNLFLHTLATLGIVGALAGGWLIYALIVAARHRWHVEADRERRWTLLGVIAGLAALTLHSLFETLPEFPTVFQIAIMLTAFVLRPTSPQPMPSQPGRWWLKPALAAVLVAGGMGIAVWSNVGSAAFDRAVTASRQGDWTATVEALQTAVQQDPAYSYYELQLGLARGQLAADDPAHLPDAIAAYRAGGVELDSYALNHVNLAWLLWETGERDAALREMTRAVEREDTNPTYHFNLGLMLEETGQLEAAHLEYAQAVTHDWSLIRLSFWDEGQPAARGRERLATSAIKLLIARQGEPSLQMRGEMAYYLGNQDEAIRWLQASLQASPDDLDTWLTLGQVWLDMGKPDQALDAAERALSIDPVRGGAFTLRARAYLVLGNLDAADADLRAVSFLAPGCETYLLMGQLAEARGDLAGAAAHYQAAIAAASSVSPASYGPWVWKRLDIFPDTLPFVQRPALSVSLIEPYLALGDLYARQGMVSQARAAYQAVLGLNPHQAEAEKRMEALQDGE